ncbi:MaoC/PaaZ C-terminal domain-containing protein [Halorubellus salinus]|uniref:MaoC/PaaZ C-terminal domain-containing protein n=1 Tax=Halorubellus salinus TaxID=755309 RepID=UPI001D06DFDE|nr:MaoC/PaaZ C-terminal domain-containing protein [Halorubellus salinus]
MTKYFEEFQEGQSWETDARTVTETDIVNFAGITGDQHWFHMDAERAGDGPFGERIAHGALVFSLMTGLVIREGHLDDSLIAYYGIEDVRFLAPVPIGETIHVQQEVTGTEPKDEDRGVVSFTDEVRNQDDEVVLRCVNQALVKTLPEEH